MAIYSKEQAQAVLRKVMALSKADECEANLNGNKTGNVRYARNSVSTAGESHTTSLVVQSSFGKKVGTATINEFDDASLEKVVRRSEELAKLAPENPEYMGVLEPQKYITTTPYVAATAAITPDQRATMVSQSISAAKSKNLTAAGYLQDSVGFQSMMNSKGLFAYNTDTGVDFSLTVRTPDGTGSGYVSRGYNDVNKLNTATASAIAVSKATGSMNAKALEPGKYTVILEPAAVAVMLENLFFNMDARSADEGRSFLSKPGGGNKLGQKLVDERVTIYSDPAHPELPTSPWAQDGQALNKVTWIDKGVVKQMPVSRYWAQQKKTTPVPFPNSAIMQGGTQSLEDLIKGTTKGILVTRLWYIRSVDPQTLLLTGLTRDGTFYIENGKIKHAVKNFRFNESPIIMLNNLEALGKTERVVSGESSNNYLLPPLKIRDFTFSSLSDAV
ncbi:TldD/PmbA family protein [Rufibacter latericius]|uniref:TldD/PmbA family protein n=1 Tax=Rufibacter latericius TaxID=2487040 RepID=A0A3M9MN29_9BACT|nr:TldD/PmbA family protein [Rufibacter latericius]RNI26078.1 TldD/PmbA family protein [Rufibacter latericius]